MARGGDRMPRERDMMARVRDRMERVRDRMARERDRMAMALQAAGVQRNSFSESYTAAKLEIMI